MSMDAIAPANVSWVVMLELIQLCFVKPEPATEKEIVVRIETGSDVCQLHFVQLTEMKLQENYINHVNIIGPNSQRLTISNPWFIQIR